MSYQILQDALTNALTSMTTNIANIFRFSNKYTASYNDPTDTSYQVVTTVCHRTSFDGNEQDFNDSASDTFDYDLADGGTQLTLVSTDAGDTHMVQLNGLDVNKDPLSEIIAFNGTTPVVTTNTFSRLNTVLCLNDVSVGTVTFSGLGFEWARLGPGETNIYAGRLAIPRGYSFVPDATYFYGDKAGEYRIAIYQRLPGLPDIQAFQLYLYRTSGTLRLYPTTTQGPADIYIRIERISGSGTLFASGLFDGLLFDESQF
jgi:hypothetical protein